jgi:hypothetical protein
VKLHHLLAEVEVIAEVARAGEFGQEVDNVLLLAEELLCQLVAALLELLLGRDLHHLMALLVALLGTSLALAGDGLALELALHRRGRLSGGAFVLVDTLHVVKEVVSAREAVSRHRPIAVGELAQMRPGTVSVHAVCLALVTEEACGGRELDTNAGRPVTPEWLQVRVDEFVVVALERGGLVSAARLALLGAVVLAILVWPLLVEDVAAGKLGALIIEPDFSGIFGGKDVFMSVQ